MDAATARVAAPGAADTVRRRTRCVVCDSTDLDLLLSLGEHPPTNVYPTTAAQSLALPRWPLDLLICRRCTLAQTRLVPADDILFGRGYGFRTGHASAGHMRGLAKWVTHWFSGGLVVDVGCNDGTLLAAFRALGWETVGVDPAVDATAEATRNGIDVITAGLTPAVAGDILASYGAPAVVTATNVLAHVDDLHQLLAGVATLLGGQGRLVAETQYAPDMLLSNAFDTVYHEHRYIWSLHALAQALAAHGLVVLDAAPIPQHGGSLRVIAGAAGTPEHHPRSRVSDLAETELAHGGWAQGTQVRADRLQAQLTDLGFTAPLPLCAVGAAAKLVTLTNWLRSLPIDWVTDMTPAKQGRYLPGTAIPIVAPDNQPDHAATVLLGAWSYLPQMLRHELGYFDVAGHISDGGRVLIPVPVPMLI